MRHVAVLALIFALLWGLVVEAQSPPQGSRVQTSALINEALDKQASLELNGPLPMVMDQIAKETGVRLEAHPSVWELLPWGTSTNVTATIKNQTLREALTALTRTLGLTYALKAEAVELQPMPALRRLGKRATVQELAALDLLAATPANLNDTRPPAGALIEAIDLRLRDVDKEQRFAVENRAGEAVPADQPVAIARNATLLDALEALHRQTPATWYPWGKSVLIVSKKDQIRGQLEKTVTARYSDVDVSKVLEELLSVHAQVDYSIEPGAIGRLSPEMRNIRLMLTNSTVKQALESISGFTGLAYVVTDSGIYIWNPQMGVAPGGRMIGMIHVPDLGMQVPLRETDIPPDLREYIQFKTHQELEKLRSMMEEEGFQPTTRPAPPGVDQDL